MWVSMIELYNVKGFAHSGMINLSRHINIFVGPNNAGKSTLLKGLFRLQNMTTLKGEDIRRGEQEGNVHVVIDDLKVGYKLPLSIDRFENHVGQDVNSIHLHMDLRSTKPDEAIQFAKGVPQTEFTFKHLFETEPANFIYPYSSKRKVFEFQQGISLGLSELVSDNLAYLVAKIDRIKDPEHPHYDEFTQACEEIIGFRVSTFPAPNGKQAGIIVNSSQNIPLEAMGEGIAHLLGLITSLCMARHNLFLIEEIENDIHPRALKALLRLIIKKSQNNQFVLSTHSNIVTKYLGSEPDSKVFRVEMIIQDRLPTSTCTEIGKSDPERRAVLEDLGYELDDFDLWKGWLFLEESSAEHLIRDYFIRWFAPGLLNKLRTLAANGVGNVEPKFEDFARLFLFTHLEEMYKNRAWVILDGDTVGKAAVAKLQMRYTPSGWNPDNFSTFSKENFEEYYPPRFASERETALATLDKQAKCEAKRVLLHKILAWIKADEVAAKAEFEQSAAEVITFLTVIKTAILHS